MFAQSIFRTSAEIYTGFRAVERNLKGLLDNFAADKVLLVTDDGLDKIGLAGKVRDLIGSISQVKVFKEIEPDPGIDTAERCITTIQGDNYDLVVALGGGSVLDIGKVSAALAGSSDKLRESMGTGRIGRKGLPVIAIPTTSGTGSEVTDRAILSDRTDNSKKGIVSPYLLPEAVIVDPEMTSSLPSYITAYTGMDALTHLIEAYVASGANVVTDALALKGIELIGSNLRKAVGAGGQDLNIRYDLAMASLMGGMAFNNAGLGAVHALALPLGARCGIRHGVANAVLLPFVMEYNNVSNLTKFGRIAAALGEKTGQLSHREAARRAFIAVRDLAADIGIPVTLMELGVDEEDLVPIAREAFKIKRLLATNPGNIDLDDLTGILKKAYTGY